MCFLLSIHCQKVINVDLFSGSEIFFVQFQCNLGWPIHNILPQPTSTIAFTGINGTFGISVLIKHYIGSRTAMGLKQS